MTYRVLVTGGRDYEDRGRVFKDLSRIREKHHDMEVWSGMSTGADQLAYDFCCFFDVPFSGWATRCVLTGAINIDTSAFKLALGCNPELVVAFPGSDDADTERAKKAGVALWDRRTVDGHGK